MKPNKLQKEIISRCIFELLSWKDSNDINSSIHSHGINNIITTEYSNDNKITFLQGNKLKEGLRILWTIIKSLNDNMTLENINEPIIVRVFHEKDLIKLYKIFHEYGYRKKPECSGNDPFNKFIGHTNFILYPNKTWGIIPYDELKYTRYDFDIFNDIINRNLK